MATRTRLFSTTWPRGPDGVHIREFPLYCVMYLYLRYNICSIMLPVLGILISAYIQIQLTSGLLYYVVASVFSKPPEIIHFSVLLACLLTCKCDRPCGNAGYVLAHYMSMVTCEKAIKEVAMFLPRPIQIYGKGLCM